MMSIECKFIPSMEKKAIYWSLLTIITCSLMTSICEFFSPHSCRFTVSLWLIYSIIARPVSVGFCTFVDLMRCTAHSFYISYWRGWWNRIFRTIVWFSFLSSVFLNICLSRIRNVVVVAMQEERYFQVWTVQLFSGSLKQTFLITDECMKGCFLLFCFILLLV